MPSWAYFHKILLDTRMIRAGLSIQPFLFISVLFFFHYDDFLFIGFYHLVLHYYLLLS